MCLQLMKEEDVDMKKIEEGRKGRKKCYIEITVSKGNKKNARTNIFNVR